MTSVYIGAFGRDLDVATADPDTGALTVTGTVPDVPDASFLAVSPDRHTLYATNELARDGTVTALDIHDPQHPVVLNHAPAGAAPTHLSVHPSGRYLLTANYGDGTVAVHPLLPGGALGEPTDLVQHNGTEPHAHHVVTDPSGQWVLATDLGADSVLVYRLTLDNGRLALHQRFHLPPGAGPRHLAFHPHGRHTYLLGEHRSEITVATWDPTTGTLTATSVVPTTSATNAPAEIAITRDGKHLYASNRGENTIAHFTIHDGGARIAHVASTPTDDWPRHFNLSPGERFVYVANQRAGTITQHPRDPDTGHLSPAVAATRVDNVAVIAFLEPPPPHGRMPAAEQVM
ncbi:MAG TPA: lactonase family protein [Actinophytocola sp.]|jgi:6-phosphogluconolactonase (cycloisomerase 2 family)|uniref:lactonase family protein n=1 Tax=Actinophytocola sp. TaxID=1872138 RepID=UPI002E050660|nr:lactonase family protein [Actinophytocola sp.]